MMHLHLVRRRMASSYRPDNRLSDRRTTQYWATRSHRFGVAEAAVRGMGHKMQPAAPPIDNLLAARCTRLRAGSVSVSHLVLGATHRHSGAGCDARGHGRARERSRGADHTSKNDAPNLHIFLSGEGAGKANLART